MSERRKKRGRSTSRPARSARAGADASALSDRRFRRGATRGPPSRREVARSRERERPDGAERATGGSSIAAAARVSPLVDRFPPIARRRARCRLRLLNRREQRDPASRSERRGKRREEECEPWKRATDRGRRRQRQPSMGCELVSLALRAPVPLSLVSLRAVREKSDARRVAAREGECRASAVRKRTMVSEF